MDFSVLWLNPKIPRGKRQIVSVKLKQRGLEASVKHSNPDQPGRLLLSCLTLPAAAASRNGGVLAGKELMSPQLEKSTTNIV